MVAIKIDTAAAFLHVQRSTLGARMHSPLAMKLKASGTPVLKSVRSYQDSIDVGASCAELVGKRLLQLDAETVSDPSVCDY